MNAQQTPFSLIDETDTFIVINKRSNIDFHKGNQSEGLCDHIRDQCRTDKLYPLHRLDTMTSGIILFAKQKNVARELALQFKNHTIEKFYCALAGTHPKKKQGTITGDMYRSRNGTWALSRTQKNPAITQFFSTGLGNGYRLYILKPCTGRTHQIRVTMKSLGVPIVGDPHYYSHNDTSLQQPDRGYLHAYALRFTLQGNVFAFVNLPDEGRLFTDTTTGTVLERFTDPWNLPWPKIRPLNPQL